MPIIWHDLLWCDFVGIILGLWSQTKRCREDAATASIIDVQIVDFFAGLWKNSMAEMEELRRVLL
jgi:hypothetical protein